MTHSVIKATDIYRDYVTKATMFKKGDVVHALKGVSFELKKGETLALVGESGCGKSTLARILTLIDAQTSGRLEIDGQEIDIRKNPPTSDMRQHVQIVFQNPYGSLNHGKRWGKYLRSL